MKAPLRKVWQGGMAVYIGYWLLAKEVAKNGGYGTVSGTLAHQMIVRILQNGDPGGHYRRALKSFPFPKIAERVLEMYFVPGGKPEKIKYAPEVTLNPSDDLIALLVCSTYTECWLAKEGHDNPIAINFMEKLQMPFIYSIVGAMLADIDIVVMGAGIPKQVPGVLDAIARGENPTYLIGVENSSERVKVEFDMNRFFGKSISNLNRPDFVPIVSSDILAYDLFHKSNGEIQGIIIEGHIAGGHNSPPRKPFSFNDDGEPIYSARDIPSYEKIRSLGIPWWRAGGRASKSAIGYDLSIGASGVSLGSIFALCEESGMRTDQKTDAILRLQRGETWAYTDSRLSPSGLPFKRVDIPNTVGDISLMQNFKTGCILGGLKRPYKRDSGDIIYRCPAEKRYLDKGGLEEDTEGVLCICTGLFNNVKVVGGNGPAILTLGDDTDFVNHILPYGKTEYSVKDVFEYLGLA